MIARTKAAMSEAKDITEALFALESPQFPRDASRQARRLLTELVERAKGCDLVGHPPREQAIAIGVIVFRACGFRFRLENSAERFTLCGTLLSRGGSCLGLTTLYVCLGEALGLPLRPILFESHAAVAHCDARPALHIETTRRGRVLPDRWVRRLFGRATHRNAALTSEEFLAVHLSNRAAFVLAPQGRLRDAGDFLDSAVAIFPAYTAAWINRAAIMLHLDELSAAEASVTRALELEPGVTYQCALGSVVGQLVRRKLGGFRQTIDLDEQQGISWFAGSFQSEVCLG